MNKTKITLALLLALFSVLLIYNLRRGEVGRVKELTYKTTARVSTTAPINGEFPGIKKGLLSIERKKFQTAGRDIFGPLRFAGKKSRPKPATKKELPFKVIPGNVELEVGANTQVFVENALGALNTSFTQEGIAAAGGTASPLTFTCTAKGATVATVNDGKNSASINVECKPPIFRLLATFTFLGFVEKEMEKKKVKTIFLSKDDEIFIVKKGDTILEKSATIPYDYAVEDITDETIVIASSDGSDILEISLVENMPLMKK